MCLAQCLVYNSKEKERKGLFRSQSSSIYLYRKTKENVFLETSLVCSCLKIWPHSRAPPPSPLEGAEISFTLAKRKPRVSLREEGKVLEVGGGDGCATMGMHLNAPELNI